MLLHEQLKNYNVILGSNSPRRRELLESTDIEFTLCEPYEVDEIVSRNINYLQIGEVPEGLSLTKSMGYPKTLGERDILITADTMIFCEGEFVGKPAPGRAIEVLRQLGGKTHIVITGVTLRSMDKTVTFSETTEVECDKFSDEELQYYIDKYQPYDKAGAYGIQEWIGCVGIVSIKGSYYNVVGLPLHRLYCELKKFINK